MKQYFYLVGHSTIDSNFIPDKIFLQEHDAIKWGRRFATENLDYCVELYRQAITKTDTLEYVNRLYAFYSPEEAIKLASQYHLESEVQEAMNNGMSPLEALLDWDVL